MAFEISDVHCIDVYYWLFQVGMDTSLIVEDLTPNNSVPDKSAVMAFLRELRSILSLPKPVSVEPDKVLEFQLGWFHKAGYFAKEVAHVIQAEQEQECDRVQAENEERKEQVTIWWTKIP